MFRLVYRDMSEAMKRHPDAHVMVSFASLRSAYESTLDVLNYPQVNNASFLKVNLLEKDVNCPCS